MEINSRQELERLLKGSNKGREVIRGTAAEYCNLCGERKYPVRAKGVVTYLHNCKARTTSGKPLKGR